MKRASAIAAFVPAVLLGCSHQGAGSASRVPVTVAHAEQRPVPYEILATGTVEPRQTASVQAQVTGRSEEHTSELQSRSDLVCRLLLEKKKKNSHQELTALTE